MATLAVTLTALAGLTMLVTCAPEYLPSQGFPLDDAWIHAVYARALARTGTLSYNPGLPATGVTSPLWTVALAVPHVIGSTPGVVVVLAKLLGFCLHLLTALLIYHALGDGQSSSIPRLMGACLVALHPDLVSASVSGMEIPLATLAACALVYAARRARRLSYAAMCVLAPLARPELAILGFTIPFGMFAGRDWARLRTTLTAAVCGTGASFGLLAVRNTAVSGLPLPATFYAKVGHAQFPLLKAQFLGFGELFAHVAIADSSVLMTILIGAAAAALSFRNTDRDQRTAAAAFLSGLLFCGVSFALIPPRDPVAYYHQRYVLPVLPLLVATVPVLADLVMQRCLVQSHRAVGRAGLLALLVVSLVIEAPARFQRLANDARNIDDVQVSMGRALAAAPASDVVWATDAGAIRYFGNAFVVDLIGLNTPALLGPHAQAVLDTYPPRYIQIVPGWLIVDEGSQRQLEGRRFTPSTPYTVTSFAPMASQLLARCPPELSSGRMSIRVGTFRFSCAP